jgi:NAD(P)-dependent dehydrogenase (short-subunit alcohol dehydrogenase family)
LNDAARPVPFRELFSLAGRRALVTGAGGGLGRLFSLAMADAGAEVIATDIDLANARETSRLAGSGHALELDVSDPNSVARAAEEVEAISPQLHVLVNNAGISARSQRIHEIQIEAWDRVINVNLRGTFLVSRLMLPLLQRAGSASVINIASVVGVRALDPAILAQAAYVASKAGVIGLTRQMAVEYGPDGVRVNAIAPGWHLGTNLGASVGNFPTPESMDRLIALLHERTPLRRTGQPIELAGLLLYLASDASSFLTGQVISHDGGWTAW